MSFIKKRRELIQIVNAYAGWDDDRSKNKEAKHVLRQLYAALKKCNCDKDYSVSDYTHFSYIRYLTQAKKAFMEDKYMRACNRIVSLIYYEPFLQKRIYYNLLDLLCEYLEE